MRQSCICLPLGEAAQGSRENSLKNSCGQREPLKMSTFSELCLKEEWYKQAWVWKVPDWSQMIRLLWAVVGCVRRQRDHSVLGDPDSSCRGCRRRMRGWRMVCLTPKDSKFRGTLQFRLQRLIVMMFQANLIFVSLLIRQLF